MRNAFIWAGILALATIGTAIAVIITALLEGKSISVSRSEKRDSIPSIRTRGWSLIDGEYEEVGR